MRFWISATLHLFANQHRAEVSSTEENQEKQRFFTRPCTYSLRGAGGISSSAAAGYLGIELASDGEQSFPPSDLLDSLITFRESQHDGFAVYRADEAVGRAG